MPVYIGRDIGRDNQITEEIVLKSYLHQMPWIKFEKKYIFNPLYNGTSKWVLWQTCIKRALLALENMTLLHANNKGPDQPAHSRSLVIIFVICFLLAGIRCQT